MRISIEIPEHVAEYLGSEAKVGYKRLMREFGLKEREARFYAKAWRVSFKPGAGTEHAKEIETQFGDREGRITTRSADIRTVPQAIKAADIDTEVWEKDRAIVNTWEVTVGKKNSDTGKPETYTNFQVKVWFKRKTKTVQEMSLENLIQSIPLFKYPQERPKSILRTLPDGRYALEVAPYDAHFGKLAWGQEVGGVDYDIKIATDFFLHSVANNLENASRCFEISRIFYILGQDLMHAENFQHQTPLGKNILDVDSRLIKIYNACKEATLKAIYMCREVAPVKVLWVPGNHDMHASFYIADMVKEHFREDPYVQVDCSPSWRKAQIWGNLLVGFTHDTSGRKATVEVNTLAQFWPELWGKSKFREIHSGHKHQKQDTRYFPTKTSGGILIRQLPALSPIDAWHYQEGYVDAIPASDSFVWSQDNGVVAVFTTHVGT
jgi:hypothetical protein